ncbi:MAG: type secretion system tip protein VgrG [Pseudomonadota bacterium]|jgi:type VI secretion system secreted protein VgrG
MTSATEKIASLIKGGSARRLLKLYFPKDDGPGAGLLVNQLLANEQISGDFTFTVTLLSDDPTIELTDVQGKMVCVELLREDQSMRYFNGHCFEFALTGMDNGLAVYQMVLRPWLALFGLRHNHRLFHNQTIKQQTVELFDQTGLSSHEFRLLEPDPERTFSCQYGESDYNYLQRRWEEMGWHYWYEHSMSGHKLIISDTTPAAKPIDGKPLVHYHHEGGSNKFDKVSIWARLRRLVTGKIALSQFDFKHPRAQRGFDTSEMEQGAISQMEMHQYHGLYGYKDEGHGQRIMRHQLDQFNSASQRYEAHGDNRYLQPGRWFTLDMSSDSQMEAVNGKDQDFLVLMVSHRISNNYLNNGGQGASYENSFTCLPRDLPWRPGQGHNSQPPRDPGLDTATVVGSKGEEIHTDKYGRIKVQFHWDRKGKMDENSSCWLRVMTPWANSHFGMIALPRVGTEVVVQYMQGNPDRPVVVGQFYNEQHLPPWDLPAHKTQSGVLTRSSKGAGPANANALRFEDKKGAEQLWMQAEKNMDVHVKNNDSQTVGNDRQISVGGNHTEFVKKNVAIKVDGAHSETIKKDMLLEVTDGKQDVTVKGNITINSSAGEISMSSPKKITLSVGGSSITITPGNITIKSPRIDLNP